MTASNLASAVRVIRASLRVDMSPEERVAKAREILHRASQRSTPEERRALVEAMAREERRTRLRELAAPVGVAAIAHGVGSPEHAEARRELDAALGEETER